MRVRCWTTFDITVTGVRNNFNINRLPLTDTSGQTIVTREQWHRSRNQQRNWDTINQLVSLRTLPHSVSMPQCQDTGDVRLWDFEFTIDQEDSLAEGDNMFGSLERDCKGVPMITGMHETAGQIETLVPGGNIGFERVPNK